MGERIEHLSFVVSHEAWYWSANSRETPEIMVGLYDEHGTYGEFALRWYRLGGQLVVRLEMFEDAFACMSAPEWPGLQSWLIEHHGAAPTPAEVKQALIALGMTDRTDRVDPDRAAGLRAKVKRLSSELDKASSELAELEASDA